MATRKALDGKSYAGNPHVRFVKGEVASCIAEASLWRNPCRRQPEGCASRCVETPRRGSLLCIAAFAATMINVNPGEDLVAARDKARVAVKPAEVVLADGVYELTERILLDDPRDANVTWRAANRGRAVIVGGVCFRGHDMKTLSDADAKRRIPLASHPHILTWKVPAAVVTNFMRGSFAGTVAGCTNGRTDCYCPDPTKLPVRMPVLSVDSRFMMPAAYPNGRNFVYMHPTNLVRAARRGKGKGDPDMHMLISTRTGREDCWDWSDADIYAWGQTACYNFSTFRCPLAYDMENRAVDFGLTQLGHKDPGGRFRFLNVIEEIDEPGEWCYHAKSGTICLYPPKGFSNDSLCILGFYSGNQFVVRTHNVNFDGLAFTGKTGYEVVVIDNASTNCAVRGCRFSAIDGHAMYLGGKNNKIQSCDFEDITSSAAHVRGGDTKRLELSGNVIENCYIHHMNFLQDGMFHAALRMYGCGHLVRHNVIHDTMEQAIGFHSFASVVEYNRLFDCCQEYGDANVIGTGGMSCYGTKIRFNDVGGSPGFNNGIYVDDCASGVEIYGNIVRNYGYFGIFLGGGRDNVISNNVIVQGWGGCHTDNRGLYWPAWAQPGAAAKAHEHWVKEFDFENGPIAKAYPKWASAWAKDGEKYFFAPVDNEWVNNLFLDISGYSSQFYIARKRSPPREDYSCGNVCVRTVGLREGVSDIQDGMPMNAKTNRFMKYFSGDSTRPIFPVRILDGTPENPVDIGFKDVPPPSFRPGDYMLEVQGWVDVDKLKEMREGGKFKNVFHKGDFNLKQDARILKEIPGFQPIPWDKIGLYKDKWRTELPNIDSVASEIGK